MHEGVSRNLSHADGGPMAEEKGSTGLRLDGSPSIGIDPASSPRFAPREFFFRVNRGNPNSDRTKSISFQSGIVREFRTRSPVRRPHRRNPPDSYQSFHRGNVECMHIRNDGGDLSVAESHSPASSGHPLAAPVLRMKMSSSDAISGEGFRCGDVQKSGGIP